jgi:hypothetical protein
MVDRYHLAGSALFAKNRSNLATALAWLHPGGPSSSRQEMARLWQSPRSSLDETRTRLVMNHFGGVTLKLIWRTRRAHLELDNPCLIH